MDSIRQNPLFYKRTFAVSVSLYTPMRCVASTRHRYALTRCRLAYAAFLHSVSVAGDYVRRRRRGAKRKARRCQWARSRADPAHPRKRGAAKPEATARKRYARSAARYGIHFGKPAERRGRKVRRLTPMRSPDIWAARGNARPAAEMFICFANPRKRGDAKPEPLPLTARSFGCRGSLPPHCDDQKAKIVVLLLQ